MTTGLQAADDMADVPLELMTQAAYARHRGVSRQSIHKAIRAGRIPLREQDGAKGIDPAEADRALGLNVQRVLAGEEPVLREAPRQVPGLTQARTVTEVYRARLAELEFNERMGKLRPLEQVELGAQRCGEVILRALTGIIARAEELEARARKDGVPGVRDSLRSIVRDIRKVAAGEFERLAKGEEIDADPIDFEDEVGGFHTQGRSL